MYLPICNPNKLTLDHCETLESVGRSSDTYELKTLREDVKSVMNFCL